jgi:hypothetical protein
MHVHRGEGTGEHDDCRAEALMTSCPHHDQNKHPESTEQGGYDSGDTPAAPNITNVLKQLQDLVQHSPNFMGELKLQIDRDVKALAKEAIVEAGVEEERTRKLRRIKKWATSFIAILDDASDRGEMLVFLVFLGCQAIFSLIASLTSLGVFTLALWPKHGLCTVMAMRLAALHYTTVAASVQAGILLFSIAFVYLCRLFKRKANIIDQYLRDVFQIDAAEDIGVSIQGAAGRARRWSYRFFLPASFSFVVASLLWHEMQPKSLDATSLSPMIGSTLPGLVLLVCAAGVALLTYFDSRPASVRLESETDHSHLIREGALQPRKWS